VLLQLGGHYAAQDQSRNTILTDFSRTLLESLPGKTLLVVSNDHYVNVVRHVQRFENLRPDVQILVQGLLSYPWHKRQLEKFHPDLSIPGVAMGEDGGQIPEGRLYRGREFFEANYRKFPLAVANLEPNLDNSHLEIFDVLPQGMYSLLIPKGSTVNPAAESATIRSNLQKYDIEAWKRQPDHTWEARLWFQAQEEAAFFARMPAAQK
jgi:hypothetical protein